MSDKLTVLNPEGYPPKVTAKGMAPSLQGLAGKKLFLIDIGFENSDNFMAQLQRWFADHEPKIETQTARWRSESQPDPDLCRRIKEEGDAAIIGVGT
ncbi:MAG: hypothetical protein J2O39_03305 [Acidimicrobiales bacterium]|nr:hypothetical protein [Acidimicrobiales bacterium]MBO0886508.1 hypothetical protein [Acidimicrobiales bacterium]MBO0893381.1 hypothetical protein [Acidimicrobiales bacterium]